MLRASSRYRQSNCTAGDALGEKARAIGQAPPEETPDTQRGDRVHAGKPEGVDEKEAYQFVADKSFKFFDSIVSGPTDSYIVHKEKELFLRHHGLIPYFVGHPDRFAIYNRPIIGVIDFKPGFEADWHAWDEQMDGYAALLFENYPQTLEIKGQVITRFHGVKDYAWDQKDGVIIKDCIQEVEALYSPLINNGKTHAGPWCRYCPGRIICRDAVVFPVELKEQPESMMPIDELPSGEFGAEIVTKLKRIISIAKDKLAWYEAKLIADPNFLAGVWEISKGRKTAKVHNIEEAYDAIRGIKQLTHQDFIASSTVSMAKLRKRLQEKTNLTQRQAVDALSLALGENLYFDVSKGSMKLKGAPELPDAETDS